jgi:hypothetical protein
MSSSDLTRILPRVVKPPRWAMHEVVAIGSGGFICTARWCAFVTDDLSEVSNHVVSRQWAEGDEYEGWAAVEADA